MIFHQSHRLFSHFTTFAIQYFHTKLTTFDVFTSVYDIVISLMIEIHLYLFQKSVKVILICEKVILICKKGKERLQARKFIKKRL